MDKFWVWMVEKGYAVESSEWVKPVEYFIVSGEGGKCQSTPSKQMLVGYMMEYILFKTGGVHVFQDVFESADRVYPCLEHDIKAGELDDDD